MTGGKLRGFKSWSNSYEIGKRFAGWMLHSL
jgi:hypothetical protein